MPRAGKDAEGRSARRHRFLGKLLAGEPAEAGIALEAAVAIVLAQVALRVVSLAVLEHSLRNVVAASTGRRDESGSPKSDPDRLAWAVDAASARVGGACVVRSVALLAILARRGIGAALCFGFRSRPRLLPGHAWVEVDGCALGADGAAARLVDAPVFEVLSRFATSRETPAP